MCLMVLTVDALVNPRQHILLDSPRVFLVPLEKRGMVLATYAPPPGDDVLVLVGFVKQPVAVVGLLLCLSNLGIDPLADESLAPPPHASRRVHEALVAPGFLG